MTAPRLAERAGIQVGDTILTVNGQSVDGFANLYGIFRAARQDPALSTVQVELDRRGDPADQNVRDSVRVARRGRENNGGGGS